MTQDLKAQIRESLSFENFYRGELGELKSTSGNNFQTLCPFHDDHNPSLSINRKTGDFKCFACDAQGDFFAFYMRRHGVAFKEALAALRQMAGVEINGRREGPPPGLSLKEFALNKHLTEGFLKAHGVKEIRFSDGVLAVEFHYRDGEGKLWAIRYRHGNYGKKKFSYKKGGKVVFYGRWRMVKIKASGWCLLVEGESDALTCWHHGIPALGMPGKKTFKRCMASLSKGELAILHGAQVYLWEEPDAGVRDPRKPLERLLRDEVVADLPSLRVIAAPKEFKDLSEAHCQGKDIKALVAELKKTARPPEPPPVAEELSLSDLGNGCRLVARFGMDFRHHYLAKKDYFFNITNWQADDCGQVERWAKQVVKEIYREAAETDNLKRREALAQHALRSEDARRIRAMMSMARSEPGIPVRPRDFDSNLWLLNCLSGTINLRTGEERAHDRADLITCLAPVEYDSDARCPTWEKFVYEILAENIDVYEFLQRALGYALTGSTQEQALFILWGSGANGKSTLINLVTRLLGSYARNTPVETLLAKKKSGEIPIDVARLDGPRIVTAKEVDRGRRLSESLIKELTGQDTVTARFLYGEYFDFIPKFKLFLCTNHKPVIRGTDNAIWRRIKLIRFPVQLPEDKWDKELPDKLWAEAPGILAWLVRGCLSWQRLGLDVPEEVSRATAEFRAEMDLLADFLASCCIIGPDKSAFAKDLYEAYQSWADDQGLKEKEKLGQRGLGLALSERGFERKPSTHGRWRWYGLGLLANYRSPDENP